MSDTQTVTLRRDEFAAYQRAVESAKGLIAALRNELRAEQERAKVTNAEITYLRTWLRDDLRITDADIDEALKARGS